MLLKARLFARVTAGPTPGPLDGLDLDSVRGRALRRYFEALGRERGTSTEEAMLGAFEGYCLPAPQFSRRLSVEVLSGETTVRDALAEVFERNVRGVESVLGPGVTCPLIDLALRQSAGARFEVDGDGRATCAPLVVSKLDSIRQWAWARAAAGELYQEISAQATEQRHRLDAGTHDKCLPTRVLGFLNDYWDELGGLGVAQCAVAATVRVSSCWADSLADAMALVRALPREIPKSAEGFR